ncbi:hypothetical protein AWZ03_001157 [Drosophila navojoa]|uniref:G patch domain-containing protein 4 n=1 Tax=Drosophila navojoa TaxID=7232 RepID=A0A484BU60_DRONA|nr:G patch domain-containing protein 4 [Drosophila navojoa]TDG52327.1 hypothetical protein AWZ03_001157 [Drosophila navojoa]
MDFGKKILGKYGWKEGDGLGKNNNGIAAPLKASLKFDNAGLGVDRATEFNDHWWERCFNEASSNVAVQVEQNGQVSTARKAGQEAVEISTKGYSARKLKKAKEQQKDSYSGAVYGNFLKSALLTQEGGEVDNEERIKVEDIAVAKVQVLTDEQLFQACGGRTAHKGARHGLKLSGKLARIEQQEREMLAKLQGKQLQTPTEEAEKSNKIKKKKKKDKSKGADEEQPENNVIELEQEPTKKSKKRKPVIECIENEPAPPVKSKKKKKKHKQAE